MPYPKAVLPLIALALVAWGCLFTVKQTEKALLLRFGEIQRSDYEPGLHFKIPLFDQVRKFDKRLLGLDAEPERFLTREKKDVIVDSFIRWRIHDVEVYFRATAGEESRAGLLLYQKVNAALRQEFGKRTVQDVVSGERGMIMDVVTEKAQQQVQELGVELVDVRVSTINLPAEVSSSVYQRMRAERERVARELRSRGAEAAERIRANADRDRTVILAEAYRESETIRGEGDAQAAETYAQGYGVNEEFYTMYRSLNAYRESFGSGDNVMLLAPDSEFFKYFNNPRPRP
jgi:membrane protease subunit HflC